MAIISFDLVGQKKEKISYRADELKFKRVNKEPVRKLKYNVVFHTSDDEYFSSTSKSAVIKGVEHEDSFSNS